MRQAYRNLRTIYYSHYLGETAAVDANGDLTGDKLPRYSVPQPLRCSLSPNAGAMEERPFAIHLNYQRTAYIAKPFEIEEGAKVWLKRPHPEEETDGTTADYVVVAVSDSLHNTLLALKKVD